MDRLHSMASATSLKMPTATKTEIGDIAFRNGGFGLFQTHSIKTLRVLLRQAAGMPNLKKMSPPFPRHFYLRFGMKINCMNFALQILEIFLIGILNWGVGMLQLPMGLKN